MSCRYVGRQSDCAAGVDNEHEVRFEHSGKRSGDKAANSKSDQSVRQHLRGLRAGKCGVLSGIINEERATRTDTGNVSQFPDLWGCEGGYLHLCTDVAELRDEAEDHVVLLVKRAISNDSTVGVDTELNGGVVNN
jgi:hypothetical protein